MNYQQNRVIKERIQELEGRIMEITQSEQQRQNGLTKKRRTESQRPGERYQKICVIKVPEEEKKDEAGKVLKK